MSPTPRETKTYDLDLSREERWVVHSLLVDRADNLLDDREQPPDWLVDLFERIEAGTDSASRKQVQELRADLIAYIEAEDTPSAEVAISRDVLSRIEARLAR